MLIACLVVLSCDDDSKIEYHDKKEIKDRWAEVTFSNVTTDEKVTTGSYNTNLVQVDLIYGLKGEILEANINKDHKVLFARNGDVLRVDYKPYIHFAEEHPGQTKLSVDFWGIKMEPEDYFAECKVDGLENGLYVIKVAGDCKEDSKWKCSLHETNYIYVRIVNE